jgi:hypothetical protein
MNKNGLTNVDLMEIAKLNNIKLFDILMIDELNQLKNKNYIINLQKTGENGSHWIAVIIKQKKMIYVDSFGGCPHINIINWCKENHYHLGYNAYIIQKLTSKACGLYSLLAILRLQNSTGKIYIDANTHINEYEPVKLIHNEKYLIKQFKNINKYL